MAFPETAVVNVVRPNGESKSFRCLFDPGAQLTLINNKVLEFLGTTPYGVPKTRILGVCPKAKSKDSALVTQHAIQLRMESTQDLEKVLLTEALCLPMSSSWGAVMPNSRPVWLADKRNELADATVLEAGVKVPVDIVLSGSDCLAALGPTVFRHARFALKSSLFGLVVAGTWSGTLVPPDTFETSTDPGDRTGYPASIERTALAMSVTIDEPEQQTDSGLDAELNAEIIRWFQTEYIDMWSQDDSIQSNKDEFLKKVQSQFCRQADGRVIASLPKRETRLPLSDNIQLGKARMAKLLERFQKDPEFFKRYDKAIQEWIEMGVLVETTLEEVQKYGRFSELPHHAVIRETSETTKLRVVNDGSAREPGKASLNEVLDPGPNFLPDILGILLKYRSSNFFIIGDVEKAFLQVALCKEDAHLILFRWVERLPNNQFKEKIFRFARLPWGISDAPFILIAVTRYLYDKYAEKVPEASEAMEKAKLVTYVDDFVSVGNSQSEVIEQTLHGKTALSDGCFNLTKFRSFPPHLVDKVSPGTAPRTEPYKVLGMVYFPESDHVAPGMDNLKQFRHLRRLQKRQAAGTFVTVFDLLGMYCPVTLIGKKLLHTLDTKHNFANWRYLLTEEESRPWHEFADDCAKLADYTFPRLTRPMITEGVKTQFHIFCDASPTAIAAVVYEVTESVAGIESHFVIAKNKIVPRKERFDANGAEKIHIGSTKINRLELNGALLAVKLVGLLVTHRGIKTAQCHYWTDSQVVLRWLWSTSKHQLRFISSRVDRIHESSHPSQWRHTPGKYNSADIASRGCESNQLKADPLWKHGPPWLLTGPSTWPQSETCRYTGSLPNEEESTAEAAVMLSTVYTSPESPLFPKNHRWGTYIRRIAYARRWLIKTRRSLQTMHSLNLRTRAQRSEYRSTCHEKLKPVVDQIRQLSSEGKPLPKVEPIDHSEYSEAENTALRQWQETTLAELYPQLMGKKVVADPRILQFGLYLHPGTGLIMSRARNQYVLNHCSTPDRDAATVQHVKAIEDFAKLTQRDLVFLKGDGKSILPRVLLSHIHFQSGHARGNSLVVAVRSKYWMTSIRTAITKALPHCLVCKVLHAVPLTQVQAPLPVERIIASHPFETVGVDFLGPIKVVRPDEKGSPQQKHYICLFTCAVTRAVHLEVVPDVGFDHLEQAFQTFMAVRGVVPKIVISDAAPTFKAAASCVISRATVDQLQEKFAETTQWKINASRAPWWGGFYERFMRVVKDYLAKCLSGKLFPTEYHFRTVAAVVSKIINSRPLTVVFDERSDPAPITPQAFLTPYVPSTELSHAEWLLKNVQTKGISVEYLKLQRLHQSQFYVALWHAFVQGYTSELRKWHPNLKPPTGTANSPVNCLKVGAVVLLSGENESFKGDHKLQRMNWRRAIVTAVHRGKNDNLIRSLDLETIAPSGIRVKLARWPVQRVTLLEMAIESNEGNDQ